MSGGRETTRQPIGPHTVTREDRFRAWVLAWLVFMALPDAGKDAYVAWSMSLCR